MTQNSSLEFKLHRLYFISLLMGGTANQREALQYAKNFQPFALNHQKGKQYEILYARYHTIFQVKSCMY